MKQIEVKQEVRRLQSRYRDRSLMYPAPLLLTWVRLPGLPVWSLAHVEATISPDNQREG